MDAKEALTVQKIRLQKPLPAKIDVEHDFEYFLVEFWCFFYQKIVQKEEEHPSQFDVAIRPWTDQFQNLEVQISSPIPMCQRVPPKTRKPKKSSSEAQSAV